MQMCRLSAVFAVGCLLFGCFCMLAIMRFVSISCVQMPLALHVTVCTKGIPCCSADPNKACGRCQHSPCRAAADSSPHCFLPVQALDYSGLVLNRRGLVNGCDMSVTSLCDLVMQYRGEPRAYHTCYIYYFIER